jgi:hypothetical protein
MAHNYVRLQWKMQIHYANSARKIEKEEKGKSKALLPLFHLSNSKYYTSFKAL